MKKTVALLLVITIVFSFSACGGSNVEATPSPKPTIDIKNTTQIRLNAEQLISKASQYIAKKCPDSKVRAYDMFTIGSIDVDTNDDNKTVATVHGYFYGYDEYKSLVGRYKFDADVVYERGDSGSIPMKDIKVFKD